MVLDENIQPSMELNKNERKRDGEGGVKIKWLNVVWKRRLKFLGHVLRLECLEKVGFLGKIEGGRARGRQRITFGTRVSLRIFLEVQR